MIAPEQLAKWKRLADDTAAHEWVRVPPDAWDAASPRTRTRPPEVYEARILCGPDAMQGGGFWREAVPALVAEVERLRGEIVAVRDPAGGPERWVEIAVHASDPAQRDRTAAWLRKADAARAVLREWVKGCTHAAPGRPEECADCTAAFRQALTHALGV